MCSCLKNVNCVCQKELKFEVGQRWKTREGHFRWILFTQNTYKDFPIVVRNEDGCVSSRKLTGLVRSSNEIDPCDLVELAPEPRTRTAWLVWWRHSSNGHEITCYSATPYKDNQYGKVVAQRQFTLTEGEGI